MSFDSGRATGSSASSGSGSGSRLHHSLLTVANTLSQLSSDASLTFLSGRKGQLAANIISGLSDALRYLRELNTQVRVSFID